MTDVVNPKIASPDQLLPYHKKISAEGKALMICLISYTYMVLNTEEKGNTWLGEMIALLCEMNRKRKEFIGKGLQAFPDEMIRKYEEGYFALLRKGQSENKATAHKYAKQDEKTLLNRMEKYSHNHLLFMHDFSVPFDDNISERDLRKEKNRQKMGIIENIKMLFMGTPAIF